MLEEWRKNRLDNYILNLHKYYSDCRRASFNSSSTTDEIDDESKEYLNTRLNLNKLVGAKDDFILHEILKKNEKNNFSFYLLKNRAINLRIRGIDSEGYSIFMRLATNYMVNGDYQIPRLFCILFERGYSITEADLYFTKKIYKHDKFDSEDELERWARIRFAAKLNDSNKLEKAFGKDRELFTIFSFLKKRPVVFKFKNLLEIAINAIQYYRESGDIILEAMSVYGVKDQIIRLDKKGKFKEKYKEYIENKPYQDKEFENIAKQIFDKLN